MGAATRPAGPHSVRNRANHPAWLVLAGLCLAAAVLYFCLTVSRAVGVPEPPLVAVIEAPLNIPDQSVAVVDAAEKPDVEPTQAANAPSPALPSPTTPRTSAVGSPELLDVITKAAGDAIDNISVSVKRVSDGKTAAVNGEVQWYAASLFKLAVLYEVEKRHFEGTLEYDDRITIAEEDLAEDLGTAGFLNLDEDGTIAVEDLLRPMIEISDNVAAVALLHLVGSGDVDATLRELGAETMTVNRHELWTTSDDIARLMEAIYAGEGLGPVERDHMRELLRGQTIRGGIPGALSDEIDEGLSVGNKTGTWTGAQHDAAFIEAQSGAYVLAILTDGTYAGWQAMHRVAQNVHAAMLAQP